MHSWALLIRAVPPDGLRNFTYSVPDITNVAIIERFPYVNGGIGNDQQRAKGFQRIVKHTGTNFLPFPRPE